jgi:hypothetical protein
LRIHYSDILLILIVAAVLAVSGCSGGNVTATPTPQQGGYTVGTPTPATTVSGSPTPAGATPSSAGQLFNINAVHSYSYRLTSVGADGQTTKANFAIAHEDTTYGGVPAMHMAMSFDAPATASSSVGQLSVDVYTRKSDNTTLGGHMKMVAAGQTIIDADIPAGQASTYTSNDLLASSEASGNSQLINQGPDTVTIDGKTYACTKYMYTSDGVTYTVWHAAQAPMPVKMQWTDKGSANTVELLSWS